jgi:hypothetical protein
MSLPPIPDRETVPGVSVNIQDLLRDKPPVMVLDMGLGSREQSLPVADSSVMALCRDPLTICAKALPMNLADSPETPISHAVAPFSEER